MVMMVINSLLDIFKDNAALFDASAAAPIVSIVIVSKALPTPNLILPRGELADVTSWTRILSTNQVE
ncbi:hypothetical protein MUK42_36633 [Musa troglodytarum]|uniref:Uncharacterized protein n=1 Tax=Musa troglodytarum TaxID=320322 RepID=A0A9E7GDF6_9LILI|nr:hypothetical protein MUK42_36633 [Musa troglodytarum]